MKKILERLCMGILTLAISFSVIPTTAVHASETRYWTESDTWIDNYGLLKCGASEFNQLELFESEINKISKIH